MRAAMLAHHAAQHPAIARALITALLLSLLGANLWAWASLLRAEQIQAVARLQLETDALARQIEARFSHQTSSLQRLASRWPLHHRQGDLWHQDVELLLGDFENFQAIEWLDADYRMRWIEPLAGNEQVVGFAYSPEHPNYPVLEDSRLSGQPRLSSSFTLQQGGQGLAYYVPLYRQAGLPHSFDGFLLGIFRVEVLISDLLSDLLQTHLSVDFKDSSGVLFSHQGSDQPIPDWSVDSSVRLGDNTGFSLTAYPSQRLLLSTRTSLPLLVLISGTLASLSLCYALWLALINAQRWDALSRSNRALQGEIVRRQSIEESLQHNQARLKLILDMTDHSHDALFIIGLNPQELVYLNRTCWHALGYTEQQLRAVLAIAPADIMPDFEQWATDLQRLVTRRGSAIFQQRVRHREGHVLPLEISVRHLARYGRDYLICVGRNNTEQLKIAARLKRLSHLDGLTGLYNRRYFDQTLASEWRRLRRENTPLGLLMLDVDYFKRFNDQLGHQAGDDALRQVADALRNSLQREGDSACRYGGEEFAVILPGADMAQCLRVAEHLHLAIRRLEIAHPDSPEQHLTISIGSASLIPAEGWEPKELISLADEALYQAKAEGRNRTCQAQLADHDIS